MLLKRLSQLSVVLLFFSVLVISFHYHGDLADHPDCHICKLAKTFSAMKKPAQPLLPSHTSATLHDFSAVEQPAPLQLPLPEYAAGAPVPTNENCRGAVTHRPAASRASPLCAFLLNSIA
jgi:hypothetical protein